MKASVKSPINESKGNINLSHKNNCNTAGINGSIKFTVVVLGM